MQAYCALMIRWTCRYWERGPAWGVSPPAEGGVMSSWLQNILEGEHLWAGEKQPALHAPRDPRLLGCGGDRVLSGTWSAGFPESEGGWGAGSQGPGRGRARPSGGRPGWSGGAYPSQNVE